MSVLLYRLGHAIARRRGVVIGAWMLALVALVGVVDGAGGPLRRHLHGAGDAVPAGSGPAARPVRPVRDQRADHLHRRARGASPTGANAAAVRQLSAAVDAVPHVTMSNPLDATDPVVSDDGAPPWGRRCSPRRCRPSGPWTQVQEAARRRRVPGDRLGGRGRLQEHGGPEQGARAARADGVVPHPVRDVRVAGGSGHADPHRAGRRRGDPERGRGGLQRRHGLEHVADAGGDARVWPSGSTTRCSSSRATDASCATTCDGGGDGAGAGHSRQRGGVRRRHRGHRAARPDGRAASPCSP